MGSWYYVGNGDQDYDKGLKLRYWGFRITMILILHNRFFYLMKLQRVKKLNGGQDYGGQDFMFVCIYLYNTY